jgi:predicted PurR-regulated permease PerM
MAFPDKRTLAVLLTTLLFAVVLGIVYAARGIIVVFLFAILFAYLIDPVVRFLQRRSLFFKNLRGPHIVEAYLVFLIAIALIIHGLAPGLLGQSAKLAKEIPRLMAEIKTGELATDISNKYGLTESQELRLKSLMIENQSYIDDVLRSVKQLAATLLTGLVVIPILAIFFLSDGANLANWLIRLISTKDNLEEVQSLAADLNTMMKHYIRAKVTIGGLSFVFCSIAMLVLGFPHAVGLGILAGILEFIPVAGWMVSATTILTIGAFTHSHWIWMAALLGLWRVLMDYLIAPRVMGHELEIHPLLAIFTFMVGGAIGGIIGVYLAVPIVAALRVLWRRSDVFRAHPEHATVLVSTTSHD